ncbi:FAD-dependent monooxygenase [Allostreptomyces psammosilenae]|uniref:2-polyprenyl-6-methoxyphenol hydroxylase-like FAD-dependent oxidoreductase n=1 Tax=Allostreptomyces psammosilenae TaxID=1892865 RepID=A0A853A8W7_9ACTN|nr:FAD-dependent monooxygenase [Allostreptomyces psammosilenae]NYI07081.1 2-polyprenyl-6-methoxyphenol hydroxylase-like FAD-dependent oxidoreductase [Allostreptomyces psammosilenae]
MTTTHGGEDADAAWDERVPVLIVGAGLAGTSTAMFLGLHQVPSLLVERHPGTSNQPKARGQSWHTMEALRIAGVSERVRAAGYDVDRGMPIVIARSVTGPRLHEVLPERWPDWSHITPERMGMASQERAEPILADRARELGAELRFSTRLETFEQDAHGVTAVLRDLRTDAVSRVRADYLVAADGWRGGIRRRLGIGTHGRGTLEHSVAVVFEADLRQALAGREFALFYLQNPELGGGSGAFVTTDTPGRYVVTFGYDPDAGGGYADVTDEYCLAQVRIALGVPDLEVELVDRAPTGLAHRIADRFSCGRVHLVGDAAHTMPPHGGQGGNTAVMDGFHLAWKLAAVVRGHAGAALLDSHDAERRPYGELIAGQQYTNMIHRAAPHLADGTEDAPVPWERLLLGYRCAAGAVVPEPDEDGALHEDPARPTGRPGSHAPHVWLIRDGERLPVLDLLGREFVLLTESAGWARAADEVAGRLGVPLRAVLINGEGGPADPEGRWRRAYGVGPDGASLVRPDRLIAWRSPGAGGADALGEALCTVLRRGPRNAA